jgi:hypothetical protein
MKSNRPAVFLALLVLTGSAASQPATISWPGAGCSGLNNYSPAMHSTAETMTAVSAIYRPTSGRLP